jgi:hypothetical protein
MPLHPETLVSPLPTVTGCSRTPLVF